MDVKEHMKRYEGEDFVSWVISSTVKFLCQQRISKGIQIDIYLALQTNRQTQRLTRIGDLMLTFLDMLGDIRFPLRSLLFT